MVENIIITVLAILCIYFWWKCGEISYAKHEVEMDVEGLTNDNMRSKEVYDKLNLKMMQMQSYHDSDLSWIKSSLEHQQQIVNGYMLLTKIKPCEAHLAYRKKYNIQIK